MSEGPLPNLHSKFAWYQVDHEQLPKRTAADRVTDFLQVHGLYDEATAREQANRCIQCPEPSCVAGCPLGNPIPQWMLLTAEGRFLEAAALVHAGSPLPEICAQLCPSDQLCEARCLLNGSGDPVSIRDLAQFLNEYAFTHHVTESGPAAPNGFRVAVVGSGPCGLTCADELARRGYAVTVLDAGLLPGGLLVNGVPAFRLEHSMLHRRVEMLRERGVCFRLGLSLREDLDPWQLRAEFDAVFLGLEARQARQLQVPGANLEGVIQALPFIIQKSTRLPLDLPAIDVSDRRVVVLGAGDTAMDCLRTAIRCGASEAICVYRRDEACLPGRRPDYEEAREEGAQFVFQASPLAVLDDGHGRVRGVRLARTEPGPLEPTGRRSFVPLASTEFEIPADLVLLALGFDPLPLPGHEREGGLARSDSGGVLVDANQETSLPGVFAGGDLVRGPGLVTLTVSDARKAARSIHRQLSARRAGDSGESVADHCTPDAG